jgi:excisionase family DNA binding protein
MESYLTAKEAAEYLKLAERTLVRLAHEGKIPGVKIGGQWRFRRALLDEYLDTLASESVATSGTAPSQVIDASMEEIFTVDQIIPDLKASNRPEVIHAMAEHVTGLGLVEHRHGPVARRRRLRFAGHGKDEHLLSPRTAERRSPPAVALQARLDRP